MASPGEGSESHKGWALPVGYDELSKKEKQEVLEASILQFLEEAGRATTTEIQEALGAPHRETVRKHLRRLATTQEIYKDQIGEREVFYRNGRLAHHTLQRRIEAGPTTEYDIRVYKDPIAGRTVTLTEYSLSPLRERTAKSGIRMDVEDLDAIISELKDIRDTIDENPDLVDPDLR